MGNCWKWILGFYEMVTQTYVSEMVIYLCIVPLSQTITILSPVRCSYRGSVVRLTPKGNLTVLDLWSTTSSARFFSTMQFIFDLWFLSIMAPARSLMSKSMGSLTWIGVSLSSSSDSSELSTLLSSESCTSWSSWTASFFFLGDGSSESCSTSLVFWRGSS